LFRTARRQTIRVPDPTMNLWSIFQLIRLSRAGVFNNFKECLNG
jgi:hypothetical protein